MQLKSVTSSPKGKGYKTGHRPHHPQGTAKDVAPIIRVKNFRMLHKMAGEDQLGVILGVSHQRLEELLAGQNFSEETAYHIETTLGLPSGFFDLLNPILSKEQVERLRQFKEQEQEPVSAASHTLSLTRSHAADAVPATAPTVALPQAAAPAPDAASVSAAAASPAPVVAPQPVAAAPAAASVGFSLSLAKPLPGVTIRKKTRRNVTAMTSPVLESAQAVANPQQPAAKVPRGVVTAEEAQQRVIRTNNLAMLTSGPGSKKQLCLLTGLTAANISHRLHGNKIFDRETGDFFCERLELPLGWFETPHTPAEVPARALELLGSSQAALTAPEPGAPAQAPKVASRVRVPAQAPAAPLVPATAKNKPAKAAPLAAVAPAPVEQAAAAPVAVAPALAPAALERVAPAAAPTPAAAPVAAAPAAAPAFAALPSSAAESSPVADALVKTLLKKVREGRLTEEKALSMLVEVMAL